MTAFGAKMAGRHAKSIGPATVKAAHLVTMDGAFVVYPDPTGSGVTLPTQPFHRR